MQTRKCAFCGADATESFPISSQSPDGTGAESGEGSRQEIWLCRAHAQTYRLFRERQQRRAREMAAERQRAEEARQMAMILHTRRVAAEIEDLIVDLTAEAEQGKLLPVIGRDAIIDQVITVLSRMTKNNVALLGEPGVGKTAIVEGLAQRMVRGDVPEWFRGRRLISVHMHNLVAGTRFRGDFEERMKQLIEIAREERWIVFIDEMHTILGAGSAAGTAADAGQILKPALARGDFAVIGATTNKEYKIIEKDPALERRFQPIEVPEPGEREVIAILKGLTPRYEAHHGVEITDEAIEAAVRYAATHVQTRKFPDKAIDLIDEAAAKLRIEAHRERSQAAPLPTPEELEARARELSAQIEEARAAGQMDAWEKLRAEAEELKQLAAQLSAQAQKPRLTAEHIASLVEKRTGIPAGEIGADELARLKRLERMLRESVVGQEAAVDAVIRAIRRARLSGGKRRQPQGRFLFLGPTGTGKTHVARMTAKALFGSEDALLQINMSEYSEPHSKARLIGSPPGYVGHEGGGWLTSQIKRRPHRVILLDEIEKAHPDVWTLLLQILEEGKLTDGRGETVDFRHTIVILTSNIGQQKQIQLGKQIGFVPSEPGASKPKVLREEALKELRRIMPPELLNRIDDIIVFDRLTTHQAAEIALRRLREIAALLKEEHDIELIWREDVPAFLSARGFDEIYGARNIHRVIQREVEDLIHDAIVEGEITRGSRVGLEVAEGAVQLVVLTEDEPVPAS